MKTRLEVPEDCEPSTKKLKSIPSEFDFETSHITGRPYSAKAKKILQVRQALPAWQVKDNFIKLVRKNQVTILIGETGSGKTTQCGQFLLEPHAKVLGEGKTIACTQPRRVAAMSVASRVADEMDVPLGQQVGYTIRFEDKTSDQTLLKFMTDGMLLREAMLDPLLSRYSVIMLDEAHERTINTDVLFGLLKSLLTKRQDLRLVIMSATLEIEKLQKYFNNAPILSIEGRTFPVTILYSSRPEKDYVAASIRTVLDIHRQEAPGDILLFLTGEEEIENARREIEAEMESDPSCSSALITYPLYSSLPPAQQQKVFEPLPLTTPPSRKVILATNIAETSITIDTIKYVVDAGFSKQKVYNPRLKIESLLVTPISKANAKQRAGRAGRTSAGKCFRLYTETAFDALIEQTHPEILRSNISSVVLQLKKIGVEDLVHFDFIDPPAPETLMRALEELHYLKVIDDECELTDLGYRVSDFPLEPHLGRLLVTSEKYGCVREVLSVVAMLSVPNVFVRGKDRDGRKDREREKAKAALEHQDGDHMTLLRVFELYEDSVRKGGQRDFCYFNYLNQRGLESAMTVRKQLARLMERHGIKEEEDRGEREEKGGRSGKVRKALLEGFFMQVAKLLPNGFYSTWKGNQVASLHPGSCLQGKPEFVMYNEFVLTSKNYLRTVSPVRKEWLYEVCPEYFEE